MSQQTTRAYYCGYEEDACGWAEVKEEAPEEATYFLKCPNCDRSLYEVEIDSEDPTELSQEEITEAVQERLSR